MATRLAIREKQLETWTAIIQECIVNVNEKVYQSLAKKFTTSIKERDLYAPQIRYPSNTGRNALCQ